MPKKADLLVPVLVFVAFVALLVAWLVALLVTLLVTMFISLVITLYRRYCIAAPPQQTLLNRLPVEFRERILEHVFTISPRAATQQPLLRAFRNTALYPEILDFFMTAG